MLATALPAAESCDSLLARMVAELGYGLNQATAAVVDRHELRHQIDGPVVPMAGLVAERLSQAVKSASGSTSSSLPEDVSATWWRGTL